MLPENFDHDEIGPWSELKLEIVKKYASAYSKILHPQKATNPKFHHHYVDAFAGPGVHLAKSSGELIAGSPLNALSVTPPFDGYHLIDASENRTNQLRQLAGHREDVHLYAGDCHDILINQIFPIMKFESYGRALCLLDPYSLDLSWDLVRAAGRLKTIEIFLNFMIMDANRNVLRHDASKVSAEQEKRFTRFWGDESWKQVSRQQTQQRSLFGSENETEKASNQTIAEAYRQRLLTQAGFKYAPEPVAMKNRGGATVYYLYFASPNPAGNKIVTEIFDNYRTQP